MVDVIIGNQRALPSPRAGLCETWFSLSTLFSCAIDFYYRVICQSRDAAQFMNS